jgi:uncharacterized membrane protein
MRNFLKNTFLFLLGGTIYFFIEILFRGFSHSSMFICGGLCFVIIGLLNETKYFKIPLFLKMFISSIIITVLELITGLIVNVWLKLEVWDYSSLPFNFMGQICILYTALWFFLSLPAIFLNVYLKYKFF